MNSRNPFDDVCQGCDEMACQDCCQHDELYGDVCENCGKIIFLYDD
jgi:hypothetical protein